MADFGNAFGGLLQGFNATYFPGIRANQQDARLAEEVALRKAADERAAQMQQFQMQKYGEAEEKDRQSAGLYAGLLGIKPTTYKPLDGADAEAAGDFMPQVANQQYAQLVAGGSKAAADLVKQQREEQLAALKARTDAWKETQAQRMADLRDKQIMAQMASGDKKFSQALALLAAKDQAKKDMLDYKEEKKKQEPLAPEQAAKVGMVNQAYMAIDEVKKSVFDDSGELNSSFLVKSYIPGTEAAGVRQNMVRSIEAALRIASGAAVPESEVKRYADMYIPTPYDNKDVAKQKLDSLQGFYRDTLQRSKTGGVSLAPGIANQAAGAAPRVRTYNPQTRRLE